MPAAAGAKVQGLSDLHRALKSADKETRAEVRKAERQIAEPIRAEAAELASREIPNIGTEWAQMRIGITSKLIYVAPKKRRKQGTPRRNLAGLLMDRAMEPALERNRERLEDDIEQALDRMAAHFNKSVVSG